MKRTRLRVKGHSTTTEQRDEAQALLREIAIIRDGGCVFRFFPETGKCGDYRKDGQLVLQYDHLNSRTHSISFTDTRLGVCVCRRHHIFFKRQYPAKYEECVRKIIGEERCKLLEKVRQDYTAHKIDLKLEILALQQELKALTT